MKTATPTPTPTPTAASEPTAIESLMRILKSFDFRLKYLETKLSLLGKEITAEEYIKKANASLREYNTQPEAPAGKKNKPVV